MADYKERREAAVKKAESFGHVIPNEMFAHCIKCGQFSPEKLYKTCEPRN